MNIMLYETWVHVNYNTVKSVMSSPKVILLLLNIISLTSNAPASVVCNFVNSTQVEILYFMHTQ